jgi:hypothetical protein
MLKLKSSADFPPTSRLAAPSTSLFSFKALNGQSRSFSAPSIRRELNITAVQGWIVIGLLLLIMLGIVGLGAGIKALPYLWRTSAEEIR